MMMISSSRDASSKLPWMCLLTLHTPCRLTS
jgi:hypothetical protein